MSDHEHDHDHDHEIASPLQAYFDWQVTTIMLAHDLLDPLDGDEEAAETRRRTVELEVSQLTLDIVPDIYKNDPELAWPSSLMRDITRATLEHASGILKNA